MEPKKDKFDQVYQESVRLLTLNIIRYHDEIFSGVMQEVDHPLLPRDATEEEEDHFSRSTHEKGKGKSS